MGDRTVSYRYDAQEQVGFGFSSDRTVAANRIYAGGFYYLAPGNNDFAAAVLFGTANNPYGGHAFAVLGAVTVNDLTITVTGTTIADDGTRTGADSSTITFLSGSPVNSYAQTAKRFIGQVSYQVTVGTAKTCNYGLVKAYKNNHRDYSLRAVYLDWHSEGDDAGADMFVRHHKATGWTFNALAAPTPPTPIFQLTTVYGAESDLKRNEPGCVERLGLAVDIDASGIEGLIFELLQSVVGAVSSANVTYTIVRGPPT